MPITDRDVREKQKRRIQELLGQGLSVRVICERIGLTERQVRNVIRALRRGLDAAP